MDSNARLIKQYLTTGQRPNAEFKKQLLNVGEEFVKLADLKFDRPDADQVYQKVEVDWQRQFDFINETRKIKNEDNATKLRKKKDTEQLIEKVMKDYEQKDRKSKSSLIPTPAKKQ